MPRPANTLSPFQRGFAALWSDPALIAGELVWRWCFGFSAWALAIVSAGLFLDSLLIAPGDQFLLSTLQPVLLKTAFGDIFQGSLLRFVWMDVILLIGLTLLWALAATAGRAATLCRLLAFFRQDEDALLTWQFRPVLILNLLRAAWSIVGVAAAGVSLMIGVVAVREQHAARAAFFLTFGIALACVFGYVLNWFLGLAPLFCLRDGVGASESVARTVDFCAARAGRIFGLSLGFFAVWTVWAGTMALFVFAILSATKYLEAGWVLLLLGGVALVYFAGSDLIYLARLGAYAALAEEEEEPATSEISPVDLRPADEKSSIEFPTNLEPA